MITEKLYTGNRPVGPETTTVLLLILLLFFSGGLAAQEGYVITGKVADSVKSLEGATVSLYAAAGVKSAIGTTRTDHAGQFIIPVKDTGSYVLEASFTGYASHTRKITVTGTTNLGTIILPAISGQLKDVTVTAKKKLIEQTDDKIIYHAESDPLARSQTAIDILRRIPYVSVDGDDNVRINGQTNFRVLLNGRETAMFAQNVRDALQGFPGATIMKIEVITNPSARYDAEGIGGIINIITKKRVEGYNGSLSTWTTTIRQLVTNANFNAKMGKVGLSLNYGTRSNIGIRSSSYIQTTPTVPAFYTERLLEGQRKGTSFWNFGNGELTWALDSLHTLSFFGNMSGGFSRQLLDQQTVTTFPSAAPRTSLFDQVARRQYPTNTVGTDFIKKYAGQPDKEFSLRVNAELGESNSFLESVEHTSGYSRYIINNSLATNRQYTVQSDFVQPLSKNQKMELGARVTMRRATSDFESLLRYSDAEAYKQNPSNSDHFHFIQDVYSAYASYAFKIKTVSFRTGLRVEHTGINGSFGSNKAFAKNRYTNILPNLQVSGRIKDLALVLSYNQRLQRPYISYLNPFIENNDSLNISFGNPGLGAQSIHTVSLQSRMQKGKTFMGLTFTGSYSDDMIVTLVSFNPATGVRSSTYGNVGRDFLLSINGNINTKFSEKCILNVQMNFQYRTLSNNTLPPLFNSGIGGNSSAGINYIFNPRLSLNNYIGFEQAIIDLQSSPNTIPFCGSGINYAVVENKLRLGLMAQNYFARHYNYTTYISGPGFETVHTNRNLMGKLVFTVNWNFGKLKEKVSKRVGVTNDDLLQ